MVWGKMIAQTERRKGDGWGSDNGRERALQRRLRRGERERESRKGVAWGGRISRVTFFCSARSPPTSPVAVVPSLRAVAGVDRGGGLGLRIYLLILPFFASADVAICEARECIRFLRGVC